MFRLIYNNANEIETYTQTHLHSSAAEDRHRDYFIYRFPHFCMVEQFYEPYYLIHVKWYSYVCVCGHEYVQIANFIRLIAFTRKTHIVRGAARNSKLMV